MAVDLAKDSIDLGIVVRDAAAALKFYRDTLGFEHVGDMDMGRGTTMHRLQCGSSLIKLIAMATAPEASPAPGGVYAGSGYRYWTITVRDIAATVQACKAGGYAVPLDVREIRPGTQMAMVEDPDGNWVEFLQQA